MLKIYKIGENVYYIHFIGYCENIKVNGLELKSGCSYSKIETVQKHTKHIRKYWSLNGVETPIEKIQELESKYYTTVYDANSGAEVKEFKYVGALQEYNEFRNTLVYDHEETVTVTDVEYEIVESPKIPLEYVRFMTPCQLDNIQTFGCVVLKRKDYAEYLFSEICKKNQFKYEIPTHSCLQYATIEGDYIFDASFKYENGSIPCGIEVAIGTLERTELDITDKIREYLYKKAKVKEKHVGSIITMFNRINDNLNKLEVKQKSSLTVRDIKNSINHFVNEFKAQYAEEIKLKTLKDGD